MVGVTYFAFSPSSTGDWEVETSDCGTSDPFLIIYDRGGDLVDYDDDSGEGYNAKLIVYLDADEVYFISAECLDRIAGTFVLTVTGS